MSNLNTTPATGRRWKKIVIGVALFAGIAFMGGRFVLTTYFDESHPPPISTPKFLLMIFVLGPVALMIYGLLEAAFELLARSVVRVAKALLQLVRSKQ